jgi:transcriptional regulator with XRE-family HTH domain
MAAVGPSLRKLREATVPRLSIRQVAEKLGIGSSSYAFYENPNSYKKPNLPLDFARRVAALFADFGVEPAEVLKLAGLSNDEAQPEAAAVEAARPPMQFVSMAVALPSEAALHDMFRSILVLVPEGASKDEAAAILARRLPAGLASIGPLALDPGSAASLAFGEAPPAPARDRPAAAPSSRT